ncbi:MAG TPA: hypothetical protein VMN78_06275 [Longimicrobiales bacterium]|nr:hypothetical protein [Longimicrobiales bacterium]
MPNRMPICTLALLGVACGDDPSPRVDFDLDDDTVFAGADATLAEGDVFAVLTENGAVKLGLTEDRVYFEVSEAVREHIDREIGSGMEESDSRLARSIGSAVRRGVSRALDIEFDFDVVDIRDVDYRDGELVFDFEDDGDQRTLRNMKIDDEPLTRSFAEGDARAFVAAFRRVKAGGGGTPREPSNADSPAADTGGDGSF